MTEVDQLQLGPWSKPGTSKAAALDNYPRSGTQRHRVLIAIADWPRTRDELEVDLHLSGNAVRPRVWELVNGGFVEETEAQRRTRDGSMATVLRATLKGEAVVGDA